MSRSLLRFFAAFATALLLLGACGGDDDEGAESPSAETSEPDDADSTDDESDDESDDEGVDTTTTADDEADDTTTTEGAGSEPAQMPNPLEISDFCGVFDAFVEIEDPFLAAEAATDPESAAEALREAFAIFDALFQRGAQLAPDAVAADMALLAEGIGVYTEVMSEYDYDFAAMGEASVDDPTIEERMQVLDSEDFQTASDNVEAYVLEDCGVDLSE